MRNVGLSKCVYLFGNGGLVGYLEDGDDEELDLEDKLKKKKNGRKCEMRNQNEGCGGL